jgi:hypothetical protein
LDNFSSFPFENALKNIFKKLVRKPTRPIQQIANRLQEQELGKVIKPDVENKIVAKIEHNLGPVLPEWRYVKQYSKTVVKGLSLSVSSGDNCVKLKDGSVCLVRNILIDSNQVMLLVDYENRYQSFFDDPIPSDEIGIVRFNQCNGQYKTVSINDIWCKCACLPYSRLGYVVFPVSH